MEFAAVQAEFEKRASSIAPLGKKLKLMLDDQPLIVDGTGDSNTIVTEDIDADCTITMTMDNFKSIVKGDLNPMMAVMTGKIKISGDMPLAMKLKDMLG